jgi:hypothetical protein
MDFSYNVQCNYIQILNKHFAPQISNEILTYLGVMSECIFCCDYNCEILNIKKKLENI